MANGRNFTFFANPLGPQLVDPEIGFASHLEEPPKEKTLSVCHLALFVGIASPVYMC